MAKDDKFDLKNKIIPHICAEVDQLKEVMDSDHSATLKVQSRHSGLVKFVLRFWLVQDPVLIK